MKTFKKILMVLCVIIIAVGMFLLGRNGLNYTDEYTQDILLERANEYLFYVVISTIIILIYLSIRYNKQGVAKVLAITVLGIVGTLVLLLAIIAISKLPINGLFFPIMLLGYVSSVIKLTSIFEENN